MVVVIRDKMVNKINIVPALIQHLFGEKRLASNRNRKGIVRVIGLKDVTEPKESFQKEIVDRIILFCVREIRRQRVLRKGH